MNYVIGLRNLGQTCYVNALLYALMHLTPFINILIELTPDSKRFYDFFANGAALHPVEVLYLIIALARAKHESVLNVKDLVALLNIDCGVYDDANQVQKVLYDYLQYYCYSHENAPDSQNSKSQCNAALVSTQELCTECLECGWRFSSNEEITDCTLLPCDDFFATMRAYLDKNDVTGYKCQHCNGEKMIYRQRLETIAESIIFTISKSRTKLLIPLYLDFCVLQHLNCDYYKLGAAEREEYLQVALMPWYHTPKSDSVRAALSGNAPLSEYLKYYEPGKYLLVNGGFYETICELTTFPQTESCPQYLYRIESIISQEGTQNMGHYTCSAFIEYDPKFMRCYYLNDTLYQCLPDFRKGFLEAYGATKPNQQGYMYFFTRCAYYKRINYHKLDSLVVMDRLARLDQFLDFPVASPNDYLPRLAGYELQSNFQADYSLIVLLSGEDTSFVDYNSVSTRLVHKVLYFSKEDTIYYLLRLCELQGLECDIYRLYEQSDQVQRTFVCSSSEQDMRLSDALARLCSEKKHYHFLLLDRGKTFRYDYIYVQFASLGFKETPDIGQLSSSIDPHIEETFYAVVDIPYLENLADLISEDASPIRVKNDILTVQIIHMKILFALHHSQDFEATLSICQSIILLGTALEQIGIQGYSCDIYELTVRSGTYFNVEHCAEPLPSDVFCANYRLPVLKYSRICRNRANYDVCKELYIFYKKTFVEKIVNPDLQLTIAQCYIALAQRYKCRQQLRVNFLTQKLDSFLISFDSSQTIEDAAQMVAAKSRINLQFEFYPPAKTCGVYYLRLIPYPNAMNEYIQVDFALYQGKALFETVADSFIQRWFDPCAAGYFVSEHVSEPGVVFDINNMCSPNMVVSKHESDTPKFFVVLPYFVDYAAYLQTYLFKQPGSFIISKIIFYTTQQKWDEMFFITFKTMKNAELVFYAQNYYMIEAPGLFERINQQYVPITDISAVYYHTIYVLSTNLLMPVI